MLKAYFNATLQEAGLDEAGRGCLAGPVVAAAVILPKGFQHDYLTDSKQLTAKQRDILREEIMNVALAWGIGEASPQEIDRLNILKASILAMHRAVEKLAVVPEHLLVDGNRFIAYPGIPHTCIIRGDATFLSIAAASVLAKTHRDTLMCGLAEQYPHYGWEHNAGYPTEVHRSGIRLYGSCPEHRKSFRLLKNS